MSEQAQSFTHKTISGRFDLLGLVNKDPDRFPFLLESTAKSQHPESATARHDILFACPVQTLVKEADGFVYIDGVRQDETEFLTSFDRVWQSSRLPPASTELPFIGGWFLFLAYELVSEIEPGIAIPKPGGHLPVAMAVRIPVGVIYDHVTDVTTLVAEADFADELVQLEKDLLTNPVLGKMSRHEQKLELSEEDKHIYLENIQRVHNYIRDGDVFQVNLSRLWQGSAKFHKPISLYENLRRNNPAPFSGYVNFRHGALLCSSPERLVAVKHNRVKTRPIAGTRPRGKNDEADRMLRKELIGHPKERAEHIMLIDLERNDLGRICQPGTVRVDEYMVIESYAHVHHIVSNVTGELVQGVTPGNILRAVFPGGTITGCPKVRCMEIIAELENAPRGAYTGSIGYVGHDGSMDMNILIRSIVVDEHIISFRAGAGLVADSEACHELEETRAKAKGLLLALSGGTSDV